MTVDSMSETTAEMRDNEEGENEMIDHSEVETCARNVTIDHVLLTIDRQEMCSASTCEIMANPLKPEETQGTLELADLERRARLQAQPICCTIWARCCRELIRFLCWIRCFWSRSVLWCVEIFMVNWNYSPCLYVVPLQDRLIKGTSIFRVCRHGWFLEIWVVCRNLDGFDVCTPYIHVWCQVEYPIVTWITYITCMRSERLTLHILL